MKTEKLEKEIRIGLHVSAINYIQREPLKVPVDGGLQWIVYADAYHGKLKCELWRTHEYLGWQAPEPRLDDEVYAIRSIEFDLGVCELRITSQSVRRYTPDVLQMMRYLGVDHIFGHIPAWYRGLEINMNGNRVHHTVVAILSDGTILELEHDRKKYGNYTLEVPEDTVCLMVHEENTILGNSKRVFVAGGIRQATKYKKFITE